MPYKVATKCCALAHLRANDSDSIKSIRQVIDTMKVEANTYYEEGSAPGNGQRACFAIVSPGEYNLEHNLLSLGFKQTYEFDRRVGYPAGTLKMYMLNW